MPLTVAMRLTAKLTWSTTSSTRLAVLLLHRVQSQAKLQVNRLPTVKAQLPLPRRHLTRRHLHHLAAIQLLHLLQAQVVDTTL